MKPVLFTTAEYASTSDDGKLSVMGIFNHIYSDQFPSPVIRLYLAAQFRATSADFGREFTLRFRLIDPRAQQLLNLHGSGQVPNTEGKNDVLMNQVIALSQIQFERPGRYTFQVWLDNEKVAEHPFTVMALNRESSPS